MTSRSHRVVVVGLAAATATLLGQRALADPVIGDDTFPIQGGFCYDVPTPEGMPTPSTIHIGFGFGEQPCPERGPGVADVPTTVTTLPILPTVPVATPPRGDTPSSADVDDDAPEVPVAPPVVDDSSGGAGPAAIAARRERPERESALTSPVGIVALVTAVAAGSRVLFNRS